MIHFHGPKEWTVPGVLRWVLAGFLGLSGAALLEANGRTFIEEYHLDKLWAVGPALMTDLSPIVEARWFWPAVWFSGGASFALWVVKLWPEKRRMVRLAALSPDESDESRAVATVPARTGIVNTYDIESLPSVLIECRMELMPSKGDANGRIFVLPAQERLDAMLIELTDIGGSGMYLPPARKGGPVHYYRCEVTSYADTPLINVHVPLLLTFIEAVPASTTPGGGVLEGPTTTVRELRSAISKLEPGKDNKFVFFVHNPTWRFVRISFGDMGSALSVTGAQQRFRLLHPENAPGLTALSPVPS